MDIVVCGAQIPFTSGGAELHMDNLVGKLRDAGHRAELVRLPSAWDRDRIFDAALAWRLAPVDADLVIATNFPSYFVRHPRKVVWLFHQHRAAYDAAGLPWSDFTDDEAALEAQARLIEWDNHALGEAQRLFTTSAEVAGRLRRFNGLAAEPLYHPPPLHDVLHPGPFGDYVFCATRLETNKRPDRMVAAAAASSSGTRFVIAGTGSMHDALQKQARDDGTTARIDLVGFVSDERLVDLYAGALGAVYVPFEEDYGYVTLQAFLAGKPVITSTDAGGVLEWVVDGDTGLVTDGTPAGIAAAVDALAADPAGAEEMGQKARARAVAIDWAGVVERLLER